MIPLGPDNRTAENGGVIHCGLQCLSQVLPEIPQYRGRRGSQGDSSRGRDSDQVIIPALIQSKPRGLFQSVEEVHYQWRRWKRLSAVEDTQPEDSDPKVALVSDSSDLQSKFPCRDRFHMSSNPDVSGTSRSIGES
jgi:hypothetical protein